MYIYTDTWRPQSFINKVFISIFVCIYNMYMYVFYTCTRS